jgi:aerobic-type carbon monoxide dehydrogenase small subunit (CoxS/CutS family)
MQYTEVSINSRKIILAGSGHTVLSACRSIGLSIPVFCFTESLSIAGNCRMCLVEIHGYPKAVASCALPALSGMKIYTNSPVVKKARENILELLLINHPLDCPICDQGGECDLQDQSRVYGISSSRFFYQKRVVEDKNVSPLVKTIMTRCIHCTRCVRFNNQISGEDFFGTLGRGTTTEIGSYTNTSYLSEIQGNVIDLCPVGALTSKPYSFKSRPWDLRTEASIDLTDGLGSRVFVSLKEKEIVRIFPKNNKTANDSYIADRARFVYESNNINRLKGPANITNIAPLSGPDFVPSTSCTKNLKTLLLLSSFADLDLVNFSKSIENTVFNQNKFNLFFKTTAINISSPENLFFSWLNSTLLEINFCNKLCFLVGTNIRLENTLINTKLRLKTTKLTLRVFGLGLNFIENFKIEFLNLNILKFYSFLEGKNFQLSSLFLRSTTPLFIYNNLLVKQGLNSLNFFKFLKLLLPTAVILKVSVSSNLTGLTFFNIKPLTSRILKNINNLFALDLSDSYYLYRSLQKKQNIFWFNTHNSFMFNTNLKPKISLISPSEYEAESFFLNMEQKIQKTHVCITERALSIKSMILSLLNTTMNLFEGFYVKHLSFFRALLKNPEKHIFTKYYQNLLVYSLIGVVQKNYTVYPIKILSEDFFLSTKSCQNSPTLVQMSQQYRNKSYNLPVLNTTT